MLFHPLTLTVHRYITGSYVKGKWVEGAEDPSSPFTIQTSWQGVKGKELENLAEGDRNSVTYKGYTTTQLQITDPIANTISDIIEGPDGHNYKISYIQSWQNGLINHYKFLAIRVKEGN